MTLTAAPAAKPATQLVPQSMPPGTVVTMPLLAPVTVSVNCALLTNVAPTFCAADIVIVHVVLWPEHAPDQPAKVEPPPAAALSVTEVLALNAALHVEPQLMPGG